jgi:flavin-dependent dehydrogenase
VSHDVIVVGARCAGAPLAMLLVRRRYRVLLIDRTSFPSDTISTHLVQSPGVAALWRWGLLKRLIATGCPPIDRYVLDFGPFVLAGRPRCAPGGESAFCPRRTVLDKLLVDAAVEAGAELREHFVVSDLLWEDGRVTGVRGWAEGGIEVSERAAIVVGADGIHSLVARRAGAPSYNERPPLTAFYYSYWSGVSVAGFEAYARPGRAIAGFPTHDGLTCISVAWPHAEFEANRRDIEAHFLRAIELAPEFAERVRAGRRERRFAGATAGGFFRRPFGPGWALVGDAGYHKDPITGQGISDAFRDAQLLSNAVDAHLRRGRPYEEAMGAYEQARNVAVLAMYDFTCELASLAPPPPEMQRLLEAVHGNQAATDDFMSVVAGTISPTTFFAPANLERIMNGPASKPGP